LDIPRLASFGEEILNPQLTVGYAVLQIPPEGGSMAQVEKELVLTALERNQWNQTRAANFLHISRNVLIYLSHAEVSARALQGFARGCPITAENGDDPRLQGRLFDDDGYALEEICVGNQIPDMNLKSIGSRLETLQRQ